MPCNVLADEVVSSTLTYQAGPPVVAADHMCDPQILYSVGGNSLQGFHARRDAAGSFFADGAPFAFAAGSITVGDDGAVYVLAYDGALNVTMFRRAQDQWDAGAPLPGQNLADYRSLARDAQGTLHVAVSSSNHTLIYATFDPAASTWSSAPIDPMGSNWMAFAVTPDATPHFAYWTSSNSGWTLNWRSPSTAPEEVMALNDNILQSGSGSHRIAVTPDPADALGVPHILVVRNLPGSTVEKIVYATRSAGGWAHTVIDQEKPSQFLCANPPTQTGDTCDYEYEEIIPLGLVASQGGGVSALYSKVHGMGTMIATCMAPGDCYVGSIIDSSVGEIIVASFAAGALVAQASLGVNVIPESGSAALDAIGRIHIALYEQPPGQGGMTVRYVLIGP